MHSPLLQARRHGLVLVSLAVFLFCVALICANRWRATAAALHQATVSHPVSDDPSITPAASTITVNTLADVANSTDGLCSLREAITAANNNAASGPSVSECAAGSNSGSDVINFVVTGTVNLTAALPNIASDMTITGPGSGQLTVSRSTSDFYRIFTITSGTVGLSGLTVRDGRAPDASSNADGGGIRNLGNLNMNDVNVSSNRSGDTTTSGGGGVANEGTLAMTNCSVTGNTGGSTGGQGGGVYNKGTLTMTNCLVSGNAGGTGNPAGSGGGIHNSSTMTLIATTISNNQTSAPITGTRGRGGGIYNSRTTTLINSTVKDNQAGAFPNMAPAGGIYNDFVMTIVGSTITGNSGAPGGISNNNQLTLTNTTVSGNSGKGIENGNAVSVLTNCTVTANSLGGVSMDLGAPSIFRNTIVAGNGSFDVTGTSCVTQGHNLIGRGGPCFVNGVNGDQSGTGASPLNPQLGPLANNGGPTQTHALLSASTALDAGDDCVTQAAHCDDGTITQFTTDQRGSGFSRMVDGPDVGSTATVDIGAYEMQTPLANLSDTSTNEDTQLVIAFDGGDTSTITSVTATSSDPALVPNDAAHLNVAMTGSTGIVTINPAANLFGTTNITVTVNRTGGPESRAFMLTVNPANDAPSFTKGADQTINEDSGGQTVNNWATSISPGPADEAGQAVSFNVTNNTNAALFSVGPAVSSTGTLTYTPAANANGSATITLVIKDDGGTANGGVDTSAPQTLTITINAVNDGPSFTKGADQTVNINAGTQTVNNWATSISSGPANESGQTLTFQITNNTNTGLFSSGPAISSTGTLTYTPATNAAGTAAITVVLRDNGGTANGGVDTSAPQTFNITVNAAGGVLAFSAASYNTTESSGFTTITVKRTGSLAQAVTVDYATSADNGLPCSTANGVATPKCDFITSLGTLSFGAAEDTKTFTVLIGQDSYVEGPETFTVSLSNPVGNAALGTPATATLTIADDVIEPSTNVIDDATNFVRQHYHDFLNREPDPDGLNFWVNQITSCGNNAQCIEVRRVDVSASFFLSIEFQQTGYLVERFYKVAYGDAIGTSTFNGNHQIFVPVIRANEFLRDTQRIGRGVIVLQPGWEQLLESNKQAYALEFVQTTRFTAAGAFPTTMTPTQFVDKLNTNAGGVLSMSERQTAINLFGGSVNTTNVNARAQAVRQVAEDTDLFSNESRRAFVLAQYYGYLRRNPNDPQDTDYTGYDFWLTKLNQFNGNYINAEMVKAFLSSIEYRQRFGP